MSEAKGGAVYILANRKQGALYTGVTSNLLRRVMQHRAESFIGFTADHSIKCLIWYEVHGDIEQAILREKRIKKWKRAWKIEMIEALNPGWDDLAVPLFDLPMLPSRHSSLCGDISPEPSGDGSPHTLG